MMSITTFIKTPQHAFFTALSHSLPLILSSLIKHTFAISWHFVSSSGTMIQIRFQHDKGGGYFFQNAPVIKSYPTISPSLPCCVQSLPFFVSISKMTLSLSSFLPTSNSSLKTTLLPISSQSHCYSRCIS